MHVICFIGPKYANKILNITTYVVGRSRHAFLSSHNLYLGMDLPPAMH